MSPKQVAACKKAGFPAAPKDKEEIGRAEQSNMLNHLMHTGGLKNNKSGTDALAVCNSLERAQKKEFMAAFNCLAFCVAHDSVLA